MDVKKRAAIYFIILPILGLFLAFGIGFKFGANNIQTKLIACMANDDTLDGSGFQGCASELMK